MVRCRLVFWPVHLAFLSKWLAEVFVVTAWTSLGLSSSRIGKHVFSSQFYLADEISIEMNLTMGVREVLRVS
jgi:hypothetical protein